MPSTRSVSRRVARSILATNSSLLGVATSGSGLDSEELATAFQYDRESQDVRVRTGTKFAPVSYGGFEQVVAVDDTLWIYDWQHEVLVVRL